MIRRAALRRAVLMTFGIVLGKYDALAASQPEVVRGSKAPLVVDLDLWHSIEFKHKGRKVSVPVAEVFAALQGDGK